MRTGGTPAEAACGVQTPISDSSLERDPVLVSLARPPASQLAHAMRLPFFDPTREEVVVVATDLITRFGLEAQDEALHLTEVAANMRAVRNCQLYRLAAREIEKSFAEARTRRSRAPASEAAT